MEKIAVTGCLGAGKTTVCQILGELGAVVVSADEIVHRLLVSDRGCIQKIEELFGSAIIKDRQVDRKKLASLAFADPQKLLQLEHILHPLVFKEIEKQYEEAYKLRKHQWFVAEVPLLFEAGWDVFFNTIILVVAEKEECLKRSLDKGLTHEEYDSRIRRLLPDEEKMRRAHYVVRNNTTREKLQKQLKEVMSKINTFPKSSDK